MDIIKNNLKEEAHTKEQDAVLEMVREGDLNSDKINHRIRENGISPSQEFAILRKTLKVVCEKTGIVVPEFEEHCKKIKEIVSCENEIGVHDETFD